MFKNKRIMVVAAHPDDELLGLGATMHKLISEEGAKVHVVILGEGITSRGDVRIQKHARKFWKSITKTCEQQELILVIIPFIVIIFQITVSIHMHFWIS